MRIGIILKSLQGYYAHIKPFLKYSDGNEFIIFHLDRLYGNTKAYRKTSDSVKFVELSYKFNLRSILRRHSLDYLIFFNPGNILEQTLILICKNLGIKTVYFQHGVNPNYVKIGFTRKAVLNSIQFYNGIFKYLFFYINFIIAVLSQNDFRYYKYLVKRTSSLINKDTNSIIRNYGLPENHTDICFVYNNSDKALLLSNLKISSDNIFVMGYPFVEEEIDKEGLVNTYVLYLSSALRASKVVNISVNDELQFYKELYDKIKTTGNRLVIKLHPLDAQGKISDYFKNQKDLLILSDYNLANLVMNSKLVIGDLSSALFYAVKYYKPIILLTYSFLNEYVFDLSKWDIGIKSDLKKLPDVILNNDCLNSVSKKTYDKFLLNFLNFTGNSNYKLVFEKLKVDSI